MDDPILLPRVLRPSVGRFLLALPGMVILAVLGAVLVYVGVTSPQPLALVAGLVLSGLVLFLVLNLWAPLVLTEEGFVLKRAFRELRVRWEDAEEFQVTAKVAIGWNYVAGHKRTSAWRSLNRAEGTEASIPGLYAGLPIAELVQLMNRLRIARQAVPGLSPEQRFGLAVGALLAQMNGHRHDCLHGDIPGQALRLTAHRVLEEAWGVDGPEALRETLRWLSEEGHRGEYEQFARALERPVPEPLALLDEEQARGMDQAQRKEFVRKVELVAKHRDRHASILAWDLCRLVAVARFGAGASYLSNNEAWTWILGAAARLQETFSSWSELGANYAMGREFWGGEEGLEMYGKAQAWLLDSGNPDSPWNTVPWGLQRS